MDRIAVTPRDDWKEQAEAYGFTFHTMYGAPYWDESRAYRFSLDEIESAIEDPTAELEKMCYEAVSHAVTTPGVLSELRIPDDYHQLIRDSWLRGDRNLYGRYDLAYTGEGPAKLLEYNADTPTSLFESAVFQWIWLEQAMERGIVPAGSDQFNSLHERLVEALGGLGIAPAPLHLAAVKDSAEDWGTVEYLADCALQAGLEAVLIDMADIGVDAEHRFTDLDDRPIDHLFKLYPWEFMVTEPFGRHLIADRAHIIEPPWKMVLSNKGLMALLWWMFPGHPNLLPTWMADDPEKPWDGHDGGLVRKPVFSREGANVEILEKGRVVESTEGEYGAEGFVIQGYAPLPRFGDDYAVIGSWIVAGHPAGIGIREDTSRVTKDLSRFVPHFIAG